jgi:hypothetical protein
MAGPLLLFGLFFLGLGFAILIAGIVSAVRSSRRRSSQDKATGVVVDVVKRVFNPGSAGVYCPVIEFVTPSGQTVRFESQFGTMPASHHSGQQIAIAYDPGEPQKAEVDSTASRWLVPGCTLGIGLAFMFIGAILLLFGLVVLSAQ